MNSLQNADLIKERGVLLKIIKIYYQISNGKKEITKFGDTEFQKWKFHQQKDPILIYDVDINNIVVSSKFPSCKNSFKHFFGYKDAQEVRLLCIMLPKMSAYKRDFDETKYIFSSIKKSGIARKI